MRKARSDNTVASGFWFEARAAPRAQVGNFAALRVPATANVVLGIYWPAHGPGYFGL